MWFPYSWLGPWRYDPSEGLLLKFSGDVVYLVLIKGSNLDKPLADSSINLTNAGLHAHGGCCGFGKLPATRSSVSATLRLRLTVS